ncbi:ABC transporter permease [Actinomadura macrotermitis]|uniref:ABC transporter permease n=1 Tax=Actinomadura macrotermitis TaxID=2585200 RepID=A0A7K0BWP1_9ACTN|nr:ABC transporter permease [Actinomadura macrotermitis]MQY05591.1 hypothetical protein [Actinomadura macrotermitis]
MSVLRGAVAAEWTKLWSLRSTWWSLAGTPALMGLMCLILGSSVASDNTNEITTDDQGVVSVSGVAVGAVDLVQFVPLTLAILMITSEYATGGVRGTLQCVPPRGRMLLAKAAVAAAALFPLGVLSGLLGTAVAGFALGEWGRFSAADTAFDALAIGGYLVLISVFALGLGTLLRSTAGTLTTAFLLVMAVPILLDGTDAPLLEHVADALPSAAGRIFMGGADDASYPQAVGLLILAAWTAASLWAARTTLRHRDA